MDRFIDDFHRMIGTDRMNRQLAPENRSTLDYTVDGISTLNDNSASGVGSIKYKLKYWPLKWTNSKGGCACGLSFSTQVNMPITNEKKGLSTGKVSASALIHLGVPLGSYSGIWLTSAVTQTKENPLLKDFPYRKWHQMYEFASHFAFNKNWGIQFFLRMESPFLNKNELLLVNADSEPQESFLDRISLSWNGLVNWRGSEALGLKYRSNSGATQINFLIIEDWALDKLDNTGEQKIYTNNSPDVSFNLQFTWAIN